MCFGSTQLESWARGQLELEKFRTELSSGLELGMTEESLMKYNH